MHEEPVVSPHADETATRRRRGKPVPQHSNQYVEVENIGFGMWEIQSSGIHVHSMLTMADLEAQPRDERQAAIDAYFDTEIEIFDHGPPRPSSAFVNWLKRYVMLVALYPTSLERREMREDEKRIGATDADVHSLIEKIAELFLHNLKSYIRRKRRYQWLACLAAEIAAGGALFWGLGHDPAWMTCVLTVAGYLAALAAIGFLFAARNAYVFGTVYKHALQNSTHRISQRLSERMIAISKCIEEYVRSIDSLLAKGEKIERHETKAEDNSFETGRAYLWTEMVFWLWLRARAMETHLRNRMEAASKEHAFADFSGQRRAVAIWLLFSIPPILAGAYALYTADVHHGWPPLIAAISRVAIAAFTLAFVFEVGRLSYYNPEWSSAKQILEEYFDTHLWWGSHKLKIHERIAARVQKAFAEIAHKDSQVGISRT